MNCRRNSCAISLSKNGYNSYSELEFLLPVPQSEYMSINNVNMILEKCNFYYYISVAQLNSNSQHLILETYIIEI